MCARRFAPNAHASLRCYLPAHRVQRFLFPPSRYAGVRALRALSYPYGAHSHQLATGDTSLRRCSALFSLLRKHAPFQHSSRSSLRVAYTGSYSSASPPQNCSFLPPPAAVAVCPPAAVAVLPQNDRKRGVILSEAKDPGRRTIGFVYIPLFVGARAPTDGILRRFAPQNDR